MVRKDECSIRTIIVVVVHVSMLRRVFLEVSVVRKDLCHFRDSSLAECTIREPSRLVLGQRARGGEARRDKTGSNAPCLGKSTLMPSGAQPPPLQSAMVTGRWGVDRQWHSRCHCSRQ